MKNFWILVRFELKKILGRRLAWIAFSIVFGIMLIGGFYKVFVSHEVNGERITAYAEEMEKKAEQKKIAGRLVNDELLEEMLYAGNPDEAAFQPYVGVYDIVRNLLNMPELGAATLEEVKEELGIAPQQELVYTYREREIEVHMESMHLTEGEKEYWREKLDNETLVPWEYDYYQGMERVWTVAYTAIVLIALMLAVCLANLFAEEHQRKTDQLVLCSRNGRKVLFGAKITAGLLFTAISAGLVLLVTAVPPLILYGVDGINAPIQLASPWSMVRMTFGEMLLYTYGLTLVASFLYCSIILCCSEMFRNSTVAVMAVIVVLVLVPLMVMVPFEYRVISQIFDLNPINVLAIWSATDFRLVPFFGSYLTVYQAAPVLYVMLTGIFLMIGRRAYLKFQVGGR